MTAESTGSHERLTALAERQIALGEVLGVAATDPVNAPMIRHWTDALGDANPIYTDPEAAAAGVHGQIVAPPAMIQVWTMPGVNRKRGQAGTPVDAVLAMLDGDGYTGVVATNCEQTYHRYLRLGESPVPATRLTGLTGPKRTALGDGYFVTWNVTWYADGEAVAEMLFRVLKFRPRERAEEPGRNAPAPDTPPSGVPVSDGEVSGVSVSGGDTPGGGVPARAPYPLRPAVNADTAFFWEGAAQGELRIQKCADCGELRHPPGPDLASGWRTCVEQKSGKKTPTLIRHPASRLRPPDGRNQDDHRKPSLRCCRDDAPALARC